MAAPSTCIDIACGHVSAKPDGSEHSATAIAYGESAALSGQRVDRPVLPR